MSKKEFNVPEFLQIKGYKYRAKIIMAGAAVLIVFLVIIVSIIRGLSGRSSERVIPEDTDSKTSDTQSIVSVVDSDISSINSSGNESSSKAEEKKRENSKDEQFDADGKLMIDTDTLDGSKAVALTFDDGPGEYTEMLLDGLAERDVKATFFMLGSCVEKYPNAVYRMCEEGHQLGNHTYNHVDIAALTKKEVLDQIKKTDDAVFDACGEYPTAFRPPYGSRNESTDALAEDKIITLWSVDTVDWKTKNSSDVKKSIISSCNDGDVILMHDIYKSTVEGALAAIDELKEQGYEFVTVNELFARYGYEATTGEPHYSQYSVYETNSPHAKEYQEMLDSEKAQRESDEAAGAFYDSPSQVPKSTDSDKTTSKAQRQDTESKQIV